MRDQELIQALRCTSAPGRPIGDCEKCPFWKTENLTPEQSEQLGTDAWASCDIDRIGLEAADRLANQNTHIAALQQEIEKLRRQNEQLREATALVTKESAELLERRWIPVETNLYPGGANLAGGCGGGNPRQAIIYVTNPDAPRNCCAGGFDSTKIGEEVE